MSRIVIAVDGPAGAGKSTICKLVAKKLDIEYIDTGAMYRAFTLKVIRDHIDLYDKEKLEKALQTTDITFISGKVFLDGDDVSEEIRMPYINQRVSEVAAIGAIRLKLVELQRKLAETKSVIMDGRDIGTNVLKDADTKIYLTASVEERAKRRYKELKDKKIEVTFEQICEDIGNRDRIDSGREINPLRKAEDAVLLDSTNMTIDEVVNMIIIIANKIRK